MVKAQPIEARRFAAPMPGKIRFHYRCHGFDGPDFPGHGPESPKPSGLGGSYKS
jgi:hypothetical protein